MIKTDGTPTIAWNREALDALNRSHGVTVVPKKRDLALDYHEHTDSILLGYEIGSADTAYGKLSLTASGGRVRFELDGVDGYVDLRLENFAGAALAWLAARKTDVSAALPEGL